jgi:hypothetical protein
MLFAGNSNPSNRSMLLSASTVPMRSCGWPPEPNYPASQNLPPPKHLVSYFAVVDGQHLLLVDHKNAQL